MNSTLIKSVHPLSGLARTALLTCPYDILTALLSHLIQFKRLTLFNLEY